MGSSCGFFSYKKSRGAKPHKLYSLDAAIASLKPGILGTP